jgi:hypothetical protein
MQRVDRMMTDMQWQSIEIESGDENQTIEYSLDATAADLHADFISKNSVDSPAIIGHEQFIQSVGEVVQNTREADSQLFAQNLLGASLETSPMIDGVSIATLGLPQDCIEIMVGTHSGTSYLRIDREGLEPVVSPLPNGREILSAKHSKGRLEIRLSD